MCFKNVNYRKFCVQILSELTFVILDYEHTRFFKAQLYLRCNSLPHGNATSKLIMY